MSTFFKFLHFVRPSWRTLFVWTVCAILFSLCSGASVYLTIPLIETLFDQTPIEISAIQTPPKNQLIPNEIVGVKQYIENSLRNYLFDGTKSEALLRICALIFGVFLFKNLFRYCQLLLIARIEQKVLFNLRNALYKQIHNLSFRYFSNGQTGTLISHLTNDLSTVSGSISTLFAPIVKELFVVIVFLMLAFTLSWKLTLITFVVIPTVLLSITGLSRMLSRQSSVVQEKMTGIISVLQETISNIKVIKAFAMENFENSKFQKETQNYFTTVLKTSRIRSLLSPSVELLAIFGGIVILWYGGQQVLITGEMKAAEFLGFFIVAILMTASVKVFAGVTIRFVEFSESTKRIFEILQAKPAVQSVSGSVKLNEIKNGIEYENVGFGYVADTGERSDVLCNINIRIKKGELVALVGAKESGKESVVDLLPRFYDPNSGSINIDGRDIKDIDVRSLRENIGIVTQENLLFNDTVRSNIACGLADCPLERIKEAARTANALSFIEELPEGFNSIIGERGMKLSESQRLRISIARVLVKNPPIVIFEEAAAAFSNSSKIQVLEAMERLIQNRTSLVIAHRLSTIKNADKILVMDHGKIVQEGRHVELLKQTRGLYKQLHDAKQFS